jgi:hypothetical protein
LTFASIWREKRFKYFSLGPDPSTKFSEKNTIFVCYLKIYYYLCTVNTLKTIEIMEITRRKRTREEVRAAFHEYLEDKKKRMEEKQRELEEIHEMRMSGMTMEEIFA